MQEEFERIAHFMKYCQALRERQLPVQTMVLSRLGIAREDILLQQAFAGMMKPSYVLVRDHKTRCIVLAIRGTHSIKVPPPPPPLIPFPPLTPTPDFPGC